MAGDALRFSIRWGIGAGSSVVLPWAGLSPPPPVPRTRAALRAVRALLEGRSPHGVPGAGEGWHPAAKLKDGPAAPMWWKAATA